MSVQNLKESAHALFEYIKEISLLGQRSILDIEKQLGAVFMHSLYDPACVKLNSRDSEGGVPLDDSELLLSFHKPDFSPCPAPDEMLLPWLETDWQDYRKELRHKQSRVITPEAPKEDANQNHSELLPKPIIEQFEEHPELAKLFDAFAEKRAAWVEQEQHIAMLRGTFNDLFDMYNLYQDAPDKHDFMAGNGQLTDRDNKDINHPLLLKRLRIKLDAEHNTILIYDSDELPELYKPVLSALDNVNNDVVGNLEKKAQDELIHPLDHNAAASLLRQITYSLSSDSRFVDDNEEIARKDERIYVTWNPVLFLRKKPDGTVKALDIILTDMEAGAEIPDSLKGLLGDLSQSTLTADSEAELNSYSSQSAAPLEDDDILLPKPANREQMQIVRSIEHSPAVLVQGPPGTGKTHTIANLLGHFLAQGKTVLVTSHTSKALHVLKEKVPKEIQPLCVTLIDDNRIDMEESVNTIIERTSANNIPALLAKAEELRKKRHETLLALQNARAFVHSILHKEFEPIVFQGDSYSPAKAAEFVSANRELAALIPGEISKGAAFPLTAEQLQQLYAGNGEITKQDEAELKAGLPNPDDLMDEAQFADDIELQESLRIQLNALNADGDIHLIWKPKQYAVVDTLTDRVFAQCGDTAAEERLRSLLTIFEGDIPRWAVRAMTDGASNQSGKQKWDEFLGLLEKTNAESRKIENSQKQNAVKIVYSNYRKLRPYYEEFFDESIYKGYYKAGLFTKKEKKEALASVRIRGVQPETYEDFEIINTYFDFLEIREQLGAQWDELMAANGARKFSDMGSNPEQACDRQKAEILYWLNWYEQSCGEICAQARAAGLGDALMQPLTGFISLTEDKAAAIVEHIRKKLVPAIHILHLVKKLHAYTRSKENTFALTDNRSSVICANLRSALENNDAEHYAIALGQIRELRAKAGIMAQREHILTSLSVYAPGWVNAIREREGIHAEANAPEDIVKAWKVRQLADIVDEIASTPLSTAEKEVTRLSDEFRKLTEKLASTLAWFYLQKRFVDNPEMHQALISWKMVIKKIGKGTGKRAGTLRAEARRRMIECQKAVPAWIMPVSSVLSSVDPARTKFDVIIIDEASQSDITSTAILYMAKKIIVVGDDEQVSPLSVGVDQMKVQSLMKELISDRIPNAFLFDPQTSLYDIASLVYTPLMLREHFRCVPDIIGYSNYLSYQGRIKPLREASSSPFKTAIVTYRVKGFRSKHGKTNEAEAQAITALIKACLEQPEYLDKTIGVISMVGEDQAKLINLKLANEIPLSQYESHQILCGNASNFQGDERDVIFLSMVDSNDEEGPLSMRSSVGEGSAKAMRQRYNVAVSRAKDQLWIVHSLDYTSDLKPGDMRRGLLEYAADPHSRIVESNNINEMADSPFETEVATALTAAGYHIVQQWQVGAYYIDMVAISSGRKIAIECDGERWHSGEDKIREDMERQSILERLGWRFIRIRGSEYYRGRSETISRLIKELNAYGIMPETFDSDKQSIINDELTEKIKERAGQLMQERDTAEMSSVPTVSNSKEDCLLHNLEDAEPDHVSEMNQKRGLSNKSDSAPKKKLEQHETNVESVKPVSFVREAFAQAPLPADEPRTIVPFSAKATRSHKTSHKPQYRIPEQMSIFGDPVKMLEENGFTIIDNRMISGILWVIFDAEKVNAFAEIQNQCAFQASLEKRGAIATGGRPAWRINI